MKRTFIAVRIETGNELKDAISFLRSGLRNEVIKWVDINNMHITLAFIGSTDEPMIKKVGASLRNDFAAFGPLNFQLKEFGIIRNINDPRIIWTGIEDPDRLVNAHEIVRKSLDGLNIKLEERKFMPHLTIARIKDLKDKNNLQNLIQKYKGITFQEVNISEIVYYESILMPTGPLYKPIMTVKLE